jgi:hypothetical protein
MYPFLHDDDDDDDDLLLPIKHREGMNEVVLRLLLVRAGFLHYPEEILEL